MNEKELKVQKRDGKIVNFDGTKIAIAIKKGFESVTIDGESKYKPEDSKIVYDEVLRELDATQKVKYKIEEIQDIIEKTLLKLSYDDVYLSFSSYRLKRAKARELFLPGDDSKKHKFLKSIESLGLKSASESDEKRENANVDGDTAMGTMLQYGSTISKDFAKAYLLDPKFTEAHEGGKIHIHDLDFMAMGTTTCCQINLNKLFSNGFSTGHGFLREPNDIMSYTALAAIAIQSNQNDQHGGQSIPAFDYYMAPGVLKTFKKQLKQTIIDYLDYTEFSKFIKVEKILKEIDKIESINLDVRTLFPHAKGVLEIEKIFKISYEKAMKKTDKITYQAMEAFIHNLNTMHSRAGAQVPFSSINFGTDISPEGRMVIKNYLLATNSGLGKGETPIFPISVFKVKEGVNYNTKDPNYDLFKLACEVSAKRLFPNFAFIDAPFNIPFYKSDNFETEVTYMGCRTRVLANVIDKSKEVVVGRGNLSFTSINLPRLGIKYGLNAKFDKDGFYGELSDTLDLVKDQLLQRFELQCSKRLNNFPFLLGQGVWMDSDKLKPNDKLRKVYRHGTLTIGFIGLAETLIALIGKHHGESQEAQQLGLEIVKFMRDKCDQYAQKYNLNFSLIATPAEGLSGRFTSIDKSIYGIIPGITDKDYYTNSFHVPVYSKVSIEDKIKIEAPYHVYTNAGHITYIELDGDTTNNLSAFEKIIRIMKESGIGYGAINHPVDRDPICGFTGVINNICPGCNRTEDDGVKFERIRRITGYLVGTVDRFNNAKQKEEKDRIKHKLNEN
jgi:anaerobic ribonucleoside-triphosphate reductase